jgi:hypothetical protein
MTPDQMRRMRMRRMNLLMAYAAFAAGKTEPTPTPGGASDKLLLTDDASALLLTDGTSFLKLASSS